MQMRELIDLIKWHLTLRIILNQLLLNCLLLLGPCFYFIYLFEVFSLLAEREMYVHAYVCMFKSTHHKSGCMNIHPVEEKFLQLTSASHSGLTQNFSLC